MPSSASPTRYGDHVDVRELLAALWRQRWLALLVLVVEMGAVVGFLAVAPRQYTATASLTAVPKTSALESGGLGLQLFSTLGELVHSDDVLDGARQRVSPVPSLADMRQNVSGESVTGTVIVRVHVLDADPKRAAAIANAVLDVLPDHDPSGGLITFHVFARAQPPQTPSSPKTRLILPLGVVLGVALGLGAGLLRDNATRRVGTADEVQDAVGATVLARLPRPRDASSVGANDPDTAEAAAFRALRISLEFVAAREPLPALVVASATPDETEGWLAANLAVSLAQVQHRVLLVDGNVRHPRSHPLLGGGGAGLVEVLRGAPYEPLLRRDAVRGLDVLGAGAARDDVAELVETRFGEHLLAWTRAYDVVVVDAPAVSESDDARVMAVAGAVLLSIPVGRVSPRLLREVAASLRVTASRLAGTVLVSD